MDRNTTTDLRYCEIENTCASVREDSKSGCSLSEKSSDGNDSSLNALSQAAQLRRFFSPHSVQDMPKVRATDNLTILPLPPTSTSSAPQAPTETASPSEKQFEDGENQAKISQIDQNKPDSLDVPAAWIFSRTDGRNDYPGLADFGSALASISNEQKGAYLQARSSCSDLLNQESDPINFIGFAKGDVVAAAARFVGYWRWRRDLFGGRYTLPLNATGCGALPPEDLDLYETGYSRILPCDSQGRQVLYFNPSKANRDGPCRARLSFYFSSLLMRNPLSITEECPVLVPVNSGVLQRTFGRMERGRMLREALPIRLHMHFVKLLGEDDEQDFIQKFLPTVSRVYQSKFTIHTGVNPNMILESLLSHCFELNSLPVEFIGGLTDDSIDCFEQLPVKRKPRARPAVKGKAALAHKRAKNAAASRVKRKRARNREVCLHVQKVELMAERESLKAEQRRLDRLLAHAQIVLTMLQPPNPTLALQQQSMMFAQQGGTMPLQDAATCNGLHERWF